MLGPSSVKDLELAKQFLEANPDVETIEVLLPDINGVLRGKWLPRDNLLKAFKGGLKLPVTTLNFDIWGRDAPGVAFDDGDADGICIPVASSLSRVPWTDGPMGQMFVHMADLDEQPFIGDPRVVLDSIVGKFKAIGLTPVVAIELEFYLLEEKRDSTGRPVHAGCDANADYPIGGQPYSLDLMQEYQEAFHEMREACETLGVPVDTLVKEFAPAQYEINLHHEDDPCSAADHAMMLKRVIKSVARRHDLNASFMAKPFGDMAGNGMHVHFSILDDAGHNIFNNETEEGSEALLHAIAGVQSTMVETMAIYAPNFNSYRRFQPGSYAPMAPTWGYENRTVALRIPSDDFAATRIEHRVSGADANPYLVLASILAGAYEGLTRKLQPTAAMEGDAYSQAQSSLPVYWPDSLNAFERSQFVRTHLGEVFQRSYLAAKRQELDEFRHTVTRMEYDAYLLAF